MIYEQVLTVAIAATPAREQVNMAREPSQARDVFEMHRAIVP